MGFDFTEKQTRVLNARSHNILVSAAAGSGKTAVLVERIIRMITEPNPVTGAAPLNIDELLVVTFTKAAAAQMRERIGKAIAERIADHPEDRHLQRQETMLHHAQITTIDSFCAFLLRNNFSEIDLDPGYRQMDETEARLLRGDIWEEFVAAKYDQQEPSFLTLTDTWCKGSDDSEIGDAVLRLVTASESHPNPVRWLRERRADYDIEDEDAVLASAWYAEMLQAALESMLGWYQMLEAGEQICLLPAGPADYQAGFERIRQEMFAAFGALDPVEGIRRDIAALQEAQTAPQRREIRDRIKTTLQYKMPAIGRIKDKESVDEALKDRASDIKKKVKDQKDKMQETLCGMEPAAQVFLMQQSAETLHTLIDLAIEFTEAFRKAKADRGVIDFGDLERLALNILLDEQEDPTAPGGVQYVPRPTALAYRSYFAEVMIDEYQDSNEVQELLLSAISGEAQGRYARFMVGDVKQSIYRFRNARPEIFVDKLDHYTAEDAITERIDLDQNFRSRAQVLDAVNDVFLRIMRREVGGVTYDDQVSLKVGARYEEAAGAVWEDARRRFGEDPYRTRLMLVGDDEEDEDGGGEDAADDDAAEIREMSFRKKEALAVALEIQDLVGCYPVTDDETHELRTAEYRDIVVLLRSGSGWNDAFREIFTRQGIPCYVDYKAGYFAAEEIREVLQALRVIDNPMQDIPLYGMLRGYFGGFTEDEIGQIRAYANALDREQAAEAAADGAEAVSGTATAAPHATTRSLLEAVRAYDGDTLLAARCREFLQRLADYRAEAQVTPIHRFLSRMIAESGYEDYVTALPAGNQRRANLQSLLVKAAAFEETQYAGLFEFLRYIDSMRQYDVDYGEANVLGEQANVVRLMTIHKSKGLEFPIVFVAGLKGQFAFKGKDASGRLVLDPDLGVGMNYVDPDLRAEVPTLRKAAVADRIRRSSLGEELRVLYVAMTRAKERLYMSGYVGSIRDYWSKISATRAAVLDADGPLPVQVIRQAGNYLDLVMLSLDERTRIDVQEIQVTNMTLQQAEARLSRAARGKGLESVLHADLQDLPQPALAMELEERFSYRYPHAELEGLYTKCSVSELKRQAYKEEHEAPIHLVQDAVGEGAPAADDVAASHSGPASTHAVDRTESEEDIPRFIRGDEQRHTPTGAERGSIIHRAFELLDYRRWRIPADVTVEEFDAWREEIVRAGLVSEAEAVVIRTNVFLPFLHSEAAARMAAADAQGTLRREQPFVLGVPASTVNPAFPRTETMLVQGIIDAFWIEDGHIVILDYKTDAVDHADVLVDRYKIQLDYYAQALGRILHLPVKEKLIYSVKLQETIAL